MTQPRTIEPRSYGPRLALLAVLATTAALTGCETVLSVFRMGNLTTVLIIGAVAFVAYALFAKPSRDDRWSRSSRGF